MDAKVRNARRIEALGIEPIPYLRYGIPIGCFGAFVVALFFLVIDLAEGRPLATPNVLGAKLFLGEAYRMAAPLNPPVIAGYTLMHGTVFVALASITAGLMFGAERLPSGGLLFAMLTTVLFAACEFVFFTLTLLAGLSIWSEIGIGRVAVANLLASAGMAALLVRAAARAPQSAGLDTRD